MKVVLFRIDQMASQVHVGMSYDLLSIRRMKREQKRLGMGSAYVLGYFCCSELCYDVYF